MPFLTSMFLKLPLPAFLLFCDHLTSYPVVFIDGQITMIVELLHGGQLGIGRPLQRVILHEVTQSGLGDVWVGYLKSVYLYVESNINHVWDLVFEKCGLLRHRRSVKLAGIRPA
jgi:hypothetical protein